MKPGGLSKRHDPFFRVFCQMNAISLLPERQHVLGRHDFGQGRECSIVGAFTQNALFIFGRWVPRGHKHQEPVQLALGQRKCAFFFLRILGGHHEEHLRERMPGSIDSDSTFRHGLEERRLGAGCRAVDFVKQQAVGEDWAGLKMQAIGSRDCRTDEISGKEVWCALNAGEFSAQKASESSSQKGFSRAWSIFDQQVTTGNRANQRPLDEDITAEVD